VKLLRSRLSWSPSVSSSPGDAATGLLTLSSGVTGYTTIHAGSVPPEAVEQARASIANAAAVAHRLGGTEGEQLRMVAKQGFIDGAGTGLLIASVVAALGAIAAWRYLPSTAQATPHPTAASGATDAAVTPHNHTAQPAPRGSARLCERSDGRNRRPRIERRLPGKDAREPRIGSSSIPRPRPASGTSRREPTSSS